MVSMGERPEGEQPKGYNDGKGYLSFRLDSRYLTWHDDGRFALAKDFRTKLKDDLVCCIRIRRSVA